MNLECSQYDAASNSIQVLLDGKIVGHIKQSAWGFQYVPVGQKRGGVVYSTLAKCKASLGVQ